MRHHTLSSPKPHINTTNAALITIEVPGWVCAHCGKALQLSEAAVFCGAHTLCAADAREVYGLERKGPSTYMTPRVKARK